MVDYERDLHEREDELTRIEFYNEYNRQKLYRRTLLLSGGVIATTVTLILELALWGLLSFEIAIPFAITIFAMFSTVALEYYSRKSSELKKTRRLLRSQILDGESSIDVNIANRLERIDYELSSMRSFQSELLDRRLASKETLELLHVIRENNEEVKEMLWNINNKGLFEVNPENSVIRVNSSQMAFVSNEPNPERILHMYSQISSEFSHSIKAPLTSIDVALTNISQILPQLTPTKQGVNNEALLELIANASDSVELIRSILKQGAGFKAETAEEIDLPILIRRVERLCREATNSKASLHTELQVTNFVFYRLNLFIGLVELLQNALEAAGDTGRVKITCGFKSSKKRQNSEIIEIVVTNDGQTIPVERMTSVFEENFSTKGIGHGHGLKAVKSILKSVKGDIEILKNTDPKLTTFRITFQPVNLQKEER